MTSTTGYLLLYFVAIHQQTLLSGTPGFSCTAATHTHAGHSPEPIHTQTGGHEHPATPAGALIQRQTETSRVTKNVPVAQSINEDVIITSIVFYPKIDAGSVLRNMRRRLFQMCFSQEDCPELFNELSSCFVLFVVMLRNNEILKKCENAYFSLLIRTSSRTSTLGTFDEQTNDETFKIS